MCKNFIKEGVATTRLTKGELNENEPFSRNNYLFIYFFGSV